MISKIDFPRNKKKTVRENKKKKKKKEVDKANE